MLIKLVPAVVTSNLNLTRVNPEFGEKLVNICFDVPVKFVDGALLLGIRLQMPHLAQVLHLETDELVSLHVYEGLLEEVDDEGLVVLVDGVVGRHLLLSVYFAEVKELEIWAAASVQVLFHDHAVRALHRHGVVAHHVVDHGRLPRVDVRVAVHRLLLDTAVIDPNLLKNLFNDVLLLVQKPAELILEQEKLSAITRDVFLHYLNDRVVVSEGHGKLILLELGQDEAFLALLHFQNEYLLGELDFLDDGFDEHDPWECAEGHEHLDFRVLCLELGVFILELQNLHQRPLIVHPVSINGYFLEVVEAFRSVEHHLNIQTDDFILFVVDNFSFLRSLSVGLDDFNHLISPISHFFESIIEQALV